MMVFKVPVSPWVVYLASVVFIILTRSLRYGKADDTSGFPKGHLKPFGSVGPFLPTDEVEGFPNTVEFFMNYVKPMRPLKMVGAAKLSGAYVRWTDEYLMVVGGSVSVSVETGKKENRSSPVISMNFRDFVQEYNSSTNYMVDSVPDVIRRDVLLPRPLQCKQIYKEMLVGNILWMSSGGTSSVVHTDSVDNIICSYRGDKRFTMIDPNAYRDNVDLDHPEGAYSSIDVDRVNYSQFPGLSSVSYHSVQLASGDCLYIPFKWIHQVRSFGSNVAVNIWWSHQKNRQLDLSRCYGDGLDLDLTLDRVNFFGFAPITEDIETLKDHFVDFIRKDADLSRFIVMFAGDRTTQSEEGHAVDDSITLPLKQIFLLIDKNRDRKVSPMEVSQLTEKEWEMVRRQMYRFDSLMEDAYSAEDEEEEEDGELGHILQNEEL